MAEMNFQLSPKPQQSQTQKQSQRLIVSQKHQQAIELLQYPVLELRGWLDERLQENPLLELSEDERDIVEAEELEEELDENEEFDTEILKRFERNQGINRSSYGGSYNGKDEEHPEYQFREMARQHESLLDSLLWQLGLFNLSEEEREIGEQMISDINRDGWYEGDLGQIVEESNRTREDIEELFDLVQNLDPPGVGGRSLEEVLMLQMERLRESLPEHSFEIVEYHLEDLQKKRFSSIAEEVKTDPATVQRVADLVKDLEPRPGRGYEQANRQYVTPDIVIRELDDDFEILVNDQEVPPLHISSRYRNMLQSSDPETREYVRDKLKGALWIINCIYQRHLTIQKVTESIIRHQRDFFREGPTALKPLILQDVADDIGVHESTVSRTVQDKYVQTDQGMFEMKFFFSSSLSGKGDSDPVSSTAVKAHMKRIIDNEPASDPFNDRKLKEKLNEKGIEIGRRTVSKYRKQLNILPWNFRKRIEEEERS